MTEATKPDRKKDRPRRRWLRKFGSIFLLLVLVLAIFHRPLLIPVLKFAAKRLAATGNLKIEFDLEGSPLSNLTLRNLRVMPAGRTPIESAHVEYLHATYSIGDLIKHGSSSFLKGCEVRNATLIFKDLPEKPGERSHLAEDMHDWFFPPVFLAGRADVENLNIVAHTPDGDFVLKNGRAHLDRGNPGTLLQIERMKIPGLPEWKGIEGHAAISEKTLSLQNVNIAPDIFVESVTSTPASGKETVSRLAVQGRVFGGVLSGEFTSTKRGTTFDTAIRATASKLGLAGLRKFLGSPLPLNGEIERIDVDYQGDADAPSSWRGNIAAAIVTPSGIGPWKLDHANAKLVFDKGIMRLETAELNHGVNKAGCEVTGRLPDTLKQFRAVALDGRCQVSAPELGRSIPSVTHGSLIADGHFTLKDRVLNGQVVATVTEINSEKLDVGLIELKGGFTKSPADDGPRTEFFDDVGGRITAKFKDARLGKFALDSGAINLDATGGWLSVKATELKRGTNSATVSASCRPPRDPSKWFGSEFETSFEVSAPNANAFNAEPDLTGPNGQFEASGNLSRRNGQIEGKIDANGAKLHWADFTADSLNTNIIIEKNVADIKEFSLVMNAKNRATASGKIDLRGPHEYSGKLRANLSDLGAFNPALRTAGIAESIGGALDLAWEGSGTVAQIRHTGNAQIKLTGGKYGAYQPISAEIAGKYSPEIVEIPTLHVLMDKTDFKAQIDLHDTEIKIHDILLQQANTRLLQGGITLPLDLRTPTNPDSLIPTNGRIFANLSSDEINLDTLLIQPKQTSPLKGTIKLSLNADGPLDNLLANILIRGKNLQAKATPSVAPANLELNCDLKDDMLALHGALQQPAVSPLQINGKLPFPLKKLLKEKKIDENSPVELSLKLEKSPVTIISQLAPAIRYIEGTMQVDAKARGTIARPELSGSATLDLPAIRMRDPNAPAINGFKANMEFSGNQLAIQRFGGEISGGPFNLTGKVRFNTLTTPDLDLHLSSQNALLIRNETITVRADSDIKIAGAFNAANVTGSIGITKSKFFREVEILPIEMPGKPAPKPPAEMQTGFSLKPPFTKWTFNVAIKSKDPFLVRGNLTNGSAHIDLKLVGTGAAPALEGMVRIENFVASLPFSRLNIDYGYAYFSADEPFVPTLDIQGASSLRDYNIRVYINGTPSEPVTVFTSDPPLPQEEIIALLGTGATTEELTGKNNVLAGRAAVLVFQKLYRKLFKQKPQETDSFITRFQLDPGAVDPRTGKQEVSARFKINDQYYLIGDIDAEGGMRGQVRYLLRFR